MAELSEQLNWPGLPEEMRRALNRKLEGLYGHARDEDAFNSLAVDKQQALLILARRFQELGLWDLVHRITNVYGEGGVGMNFEAWPMVASKLESRSDFTSRFANHKDTTKGYIERGVGRASLHILYVEDKDKNRNWAAHFDLYNPWASPMNAWRHLLHEKFQHYTPDWRAISASIWKTGDRG
ncbi:MAG: hypothetical protein WBP93_13535 [Pyrinomonadaceae bacterium]